MINLGQALCAICALCPRLVYDNIYKLFEQNFVPFHALQQHHAQIQTNAATLELFQDKVHVRVSTHNWDQL